MMREMGGYIGMERYAGSLWHPNAIALNCGRHCLTYLVKSKKIGKVAIPMLSCDSILQPLRDLGVDYRYYPIDGRFMPDGLEARKNEWVYVINYCGQVQNADLAALKGKYHQIIVDNSHAFFQGSIEGVDTIYNCRKYFGVSDGALLNTDSVLDERMDTDESFSHMLFLLGRFERNASEFYELYKSNNDRFEKEPIKKMSRLTANILRSIDYGLVKRRRSANFLRLYEAFKGINRLDVKASAGEYMYPLMVEGGSHLKSRLHSKNIYVPTLWPEVLGRCAENSPEHEIVDNTLLLPVDQRYSGKDMEYLIDCVKSLL